MYERDFSGRNQKAVRSPGCDYHFAVVDEVLTSRLKDAPEIGHPSDAQQNQWFPGLPRAQVTTSNQTFGVRFRTTETFTSACIPGSTSTGGQDGLSLKSSV